MKNEVFRQVLGCIGDENSVLRSTLASLISSFVKRGYVQLLPLIGQLLEVTKKGDMKTFAEGAAKCLSVLIEDNEKIIKSQFTKNEVSQLIDLLLPFANPTYVTTTSQAPIPTPVRIICDVLQMVRAFSTDSPITFMEGGKLEPYLKCLFACAGHSEAAVIEEVFKSFSALVSFPCVCTSPGAPLTHPLLPYLTPLLQFAISHLSSGNADVVAEAVDFVRTFVEVPWTEEGEKGNVLIKNEQVKQAIPILIPKLIELMQYSDVDLFEFQNSLSTDQSRVDDDKSIAPTIVADTTGAEAALQKKRDEEDLEDDAIAEQMASTATPRKNCGNAFELLSWYFPEEVVQAATGVIGRLLQMEGEEKWLERESAVFCTGLLGKYCSTDRAMASIVPTLVPWLESLAQDKHPLIRMICHWALGRYARWLCGPLDAEDVKNGYHEEEAEMEKAGRPIHRAADRQMLTKALGVFVNGMLDTFKVVQRSACTSIIYVVEEAHSRIRPYVVTLLQNVFVAFDKYQKRNVRTLCEVIDAIVNAAGALFRSAEVLSALMGQLLKKLYNLPQKDEILVPQILMSIANLVHNITGAALESYSVDIFKYCTGIIGMVLGEEKTEQTRYEAEQRARGKTVQQTWNLDFDGDNYEESEAVSATAAFNVLSSFIKTTPAEKLLNALFIQSPFAVALMAACRSRAPFLLRSALQTLMNLAVYVPVTLTTKLPDELFRTSECASLLGISAAPQSLLADLFPLVLLRMIPGHIVAAGQPPPTPALNFERVSDHALSHFSVSTAAVRCASEIIVGCMNASSLAPFLPQMLHALVPMMLYAAPIITSTPTSIAPIPLPHSAVPSREDEPATPDHPAFAYAAHCADCLCRVGASFPQPVAAALAAPGSLPTLSFLQQCPSLARSFLAAVEHRSLNLGKYTVTSAAVGLCEMIKASNYTPFAADLPLLLSALLSLNPVVPTMGSPYPPASDPIAAEAKTRLYEVLSKIAGVCRSQSAWTQTCAALSTEQQQLLTSYYNISSS
eukprot:MONOS_14357.2-p1 / transcript=MONOS_14357.2 / gene=MONOS_14357 / organism=Monocercomonoides_exilis_PA203 / gene_product=transportin 1 , transportin-1-like protein / transcript_product=transportin 1 / location=Mono_scaffold00988:12061-16081(-) / protein_length=1016 / sequence_SO=supercontig / SO=protein_coding / is_pseudo=false